MKGKLHRLRLSCARLTLLIANPWPFNDGVLFFGSPTGEVENTPISDENRTSGSHGDNNLVISHARIKEGGVDDVVAKFIGFGKIAARLFETKGHLNWIDKIWCEWLGDKGPTDDEKANVTEHDFAIVTFSYFYNLGRPGLFENPSQTGESGNGKDSGKKKKKSSTSADNPNTSRKPNRTVKKEAK